MTALRYARLILLLSPAIGLLAAVTWYIAKPVYVPSQSGVYVEPQPDGGGKLVVLVVFDQMRADFVSRWATHFEQDGFERMKREGVWYSNVLLPYACSSTGPGHATVVTGVLPSTHGIIENRWFERGKTVGADTSDEPYERVPRLDGGPQAKWPAVAPSRLLAPTVGDALKEQKRGRVYSFALKARAAVLMGGKEPTALYCFDSSAGEFHTSSYYRSKIHDWADAFDRNRVAYRWMGKTWDKLKPNASEAGLTPDDTKGEGGRIFSKDRITFPYKMPSANDRTASYFDSLEYSPFGNELVWEFAKTAIAGDNIGRNGSTDLLCVSFSSNDLIGHSFGPDSQEVFDITLRSDKLLAEMLKHLDEKIGKDRYSLVVTSDHGISPLPEVAMKTHPTAARMHVGDLLAGLDAALDKAFGTVDGAPGQWIEKDARAIDVHPWVYFNRRTIDAVGAPLAKVEEYVANWVREKPNVLTTYTRTDILAGKFTTPEQQKFGPLVRAATHPDRAGDVYIVTQPYVQVSGAFGLGVDHGSPHDYDRQVPILLFGNAVPKLGEVKDEKSTLLVAPLLAQLLGIKPPAGATEPVPETIKLASGS
jgi:hypothetical protein